MKYWNLYKDVWDFHKKYADVKNTDDYYSALAEESSGIVKKYENHKFAVDLLLAVVNELERKCKEMANNADKTVQGLYAK